MTAPPQGLPLGSTVRLARGARWIDGGRGLVGGAPPRVARLAPLAAAAIVDRELVIADDVSTRLGEHLLESGLGNPVAVTLPTIPLRLLTVVVPVFERPAPLERLLESLPRAVARVIVVDDASADAAAIATVVTAAGADLVRLDVNGGPAAARNAGLARVGTPFVAFIDSDVEVEDDTLDLLLRHFADARVAMTAPRVLTRATSRSTWISRYEDARSSLDLGPDASLVRPRSPVSWVSSTCLVARVSALGRGFDASMRVGEDVDLVWRLVGEGRRVRFEPAARVHHASRETVRAWLGRKYFYGTGADPLATRHPAEIAPAVLPLWGAVALVLASVQRPWAAVAAGSVAAASLIALARRLGHVSHPWRLASELTASGVAAVAGQGAALVVRHWWPAFAALAIVSSRARRLVIAAAVLDAAWEFIRLRPPLDPLRFAVARRLDDLAYGAGVWAGAVRGRSLGALRPAIARTSRSRQRRSSRAAVQTAG